MDGQLYAGIIDQPTITENRLYIYMCVCVITIRRLNENNYVISIESTNIKKKKHAT